MEGAIIVRVTDTLAAYKKRKEMYSRSPPLPRKAMGKVEKNSSKTISLTV